MKIIKPSFEIFNIPDATDEVAVYKHLEKIARICYKSEDKISDDSYKKMLKHLCTREHWAMFEHYVFTVSVPAWLYIDINGIRPRLSDDPNILNKIGFFKSTCWDDTSDNRYKYLISFSITALNRIISYPGFKFEDNLGLIELFKFMKTKYPLITYGELDDVKNMGMITSLYGYDENVKLLTRDEIKSLPDNLREVHDTMTVQFVVDRGVTHEIVRHRPASYAQESTRYCNYSLDKFGRELNVIKPCFFEEGTKLYEIWEKGCLDSEKAYFELLDNGATPQQARSVLHHSIKADLVMTANIHEYKHFFKMRCASDAHPQMIEVARPLLIEANTVNDYYKDLFEDKMYLVEGNE